MNEGGFANEFCEIIGIMFIMQAIYAVLLVIFTLFWFWIDHFTNNTWIRGFGRVATFLFMITGLLVIYNEISAQKQEIKHVNQSVIVAVKEANVRSLPTVKSTIVARAEKDVSFSNVSISKGWVKTPRGYISSGLCKVKKNVTIENIKKRKIDGCLSVFIFFSALYVLMITLAFADSRRKSP